VIVGAVLLLLGERVPERLERGASAPDFSLPRLGDGAPLALSELRGRVVLVNFWATWCKPCEDEMPAMERLYRQLHPEGFDLVAISVDKEPEEVKLFRQRMGITFPILLDPGEGTARDYQTTGFPESILVDRSGRIVERYVGPREWDASLYAERIRGLLEAG